jgi:hypothetical protein
MTYGGTEKLHAVRYVLAALRKSRELIERSGKTIDHTVRNVRAVRLEMIPDIADVLLGTTAEKVRGHHSAR